MRYDVELKRQFIDDRRGAIAIISAFSVFMLLATVGLALDYVRSYTVAGKLRAAADAAAMAAAKMLDVPSATDADVTKVAENYFKAHLNALGVGDVDTSPLNVDIDRPAAKVVVTSDVSVGTTFAKIMGADSVTFGVSSTAVYKVKSVELAMVLDVTGSMMEDGRLDGLKDAAKNVIDVILGGSSNYHNRVALVPYSAAVNVGWYASAASGGNSVDGCVLERLQPAFRDTDEPAGPARDFAVNGELNSAATGRYICPDAVLMPLSKNISDLKATIDSYMAGGWTAGHIGLAWGWNVLSPKWGSLFSGESKPKPYNSKDYIKAVLLMSDGAFNTAYSGGSSDAEQVAESSARALALCANMKAAGIRIYSVAFAAPPEAELLLSTCASEPANFFLASDNEALNDAFQTIAENLHSLRIAE